MLFSRWFPAGDCIEIEEERERELATRERRELRPYDDVAPCVYQDLETDVCSYRANVVKTAID